MTFLLPPGINGLMYIALHSQWKQKSFRKMLFPLKAVCSGTEWKMIRYNGNIVLVCKRTLSHLAKLSRRSVSLNVWVFIYELSACGFESHCNHLNLRYHACFGLGFQPISEERFTRYIYATWKKHTVLVITLRQFSILLLRRL